MLKRTLKSFIYLILLVSTISCVKDVDFDQADDFSLTPTIATSIVQTEVGASQFSEQGLELEIVRDSVANIEIFETEFVKDNLVKAELFFEAINTINRSFNLQIDFLNSTDDLQHSLSFDALESSSGNAITTEFIEVFEDDSLDELKLTTKMVITLRLFPSNDGSMLNQNSQGEISLKSKGIFYFNVNL